MSNPLNRILSALPYIGLAILLTATLGAGCSSDQPAAPEGKSALWVGGLRPGWDLEDMVKQSDAVVIGVVSDGLGTKLEPGGNNDPPLYHYEFEDFAFTVEEVLYPENGELPDRIAIMTEVGITTASTDLTVSGGNDIPEFQIGERVLVFLDSLDDPVYAAEGVGRPVPKGFTESSYFQVVIGARYSKLSPNEGKWKDAVSKKVLERDELVAAIKQVAATTQ